MGKLAINMNPITSDERKVAATSLPEKRFVLPVPLDAPPVSTISNRHGRASGCWTYRNAEGAILFHVLRFDQIGKRKEIIPYGFGTVGVASARWLEGLPSPDRRPIYQLDQLAARPDDRVILVEGEKSADAAGKLFPQLVATTWPGGSNNEGKADLEPLRGRTVLIWPDNDDPGRSCMKRIASRLLLLGCNVSVVDPAKLVTIMPDQPHNRRAPIDKWDVADAFNEWSDHDALRSAFYSSLEQEQVQPKFISFGPFQMSDSGLTVEVNRRNNADESETKLLVSGPFEVIGRVRDPQGSGWAKMIRWADEDGRTHHSTIADADLFGDVRTIQSSLAAQGLRLVRGAGGHLADYLTNVSVVDRVTVVNRTGWHYVKNTHVFVLPSGAIGSPDGETVVLANTTSSPFETCGSLESWRAGVASLVAEQSRHVFAVSVAFAGPLLGLMGLEGGGFNLFGGSSSGKSTALEAAASVWGRGAVPGFVRSWRATGNALEALAAVHSDSLFALDEIGVVDAREAGNAIYQLATGSGKGRAGREGNLRSSLSWRVLVLSSGEMPLDAKMAEAKQRTMAGQAVRLVDIPADAGAGFGAFDSLGKNEKAKDLADAIKRAARSDYGFAGPEFVRHLVADSVDDLRTEITAAIRNFVKERVPSDADGQVRRVADRFGLVATAGEMAIGFGLVPWAAGDALRAAASCFNAWLDRRGGGDPQEVRDAIEAVRAFLQVNGDARFENLDNASPINPFTRLAGYRSGDSSDRTYYIIPSVFANEVIEGQDPKFVAKLLHERGYLIKATDGFQPKKRIRSAPPARFYHVRSNIISDS